LTSITLFHCSVVILPNKPSRVMPALFTRMSRRSNRSLIDLNRDHTESESATSQANPAIRSLAAPASFDAAISRHALSTSA
jgi:hypothetical protein